MASSSSSRHQNKKFNPFSGIEPAGTRWNTSESSRLFDVFINHRGPDVKLTLATQLYNSLEKLGIRAFLDFREKELGDSFLSIIKTAIHSAKVHIAIFSPKYAESPWCLAELVQMLDSKTKIIPVFYRVEPRDLRHIEKGQYAAAFISYEAKSRHLDKLGEWKEALNSLSLIAGVEFHSPSDIQIIVEAVQKEVHRKRSLPVPEYPVGLNKLVEDFEKRCLDELVQDFENQCGLTERKHKPKIVGIFGMAGIGKTTLAKELFNRKHSNYSRASFLFDMREASVKNELPSLQRKLLTDLFYEKNLDFRNIEEGKSHIKDCLKRCRCLNFLIVLDDIDHTEQLDALLIKDILAKSNNSLIIVTTRDVGVLITADITVGYKLRRMDANDGSELFSWHAFGQPRPGTEYEALVDEFVELCGGLPLSLQVLGRHVHGRDLSYWKLELSKARTTLPRDVLKRLRISFDSLDDEQKQVFIDTACFFVGHKRSVAETAWKLSGWINGQHALETLIDKCLVEELRQPGLSTVLRMHDQLRDLGRELARELSPPAPRRLWRPQDLQSLESMDFKTMPTTTNIRCFCSFVTEPSIDLRVTFLLGESDSFVQTSACLLWLEIEGTSVEEEHTIEDAPAPLYGHTIEHTIEEEEHTMENKLAEMLFRMRIDCGEIVIPGNFNVRAAMGGLEKLTSDGEHCRSKIIISGNDYPGLQFIGLHNIKNLVEVDLRMVKTLKFLHITKCKNLQSVSGISDLPNLVELSMIGCESLVELKILRCPELKEMPVLRGLNCLERIAIDGCGFPELLLKNCPNLRSVSAKFQFTEAHICTCPQLEELSICLPRSSSSLKQFMIHTCEKLENIAGIENLHVQEYIGLAYCNARKCIHLLKSLPSQGLDIVGRAVDGAESILNANLFYEANGGVDGVYQIGIDQDYPKWSELSTVIVCFLVVVDSMTSVEDIYQSLPGIKGVYLNEGEWIYTMVTCNGWRHTYYLTAHMEDILQKKGILKKGFRVEVRKGEEWNSLSLLHTIVDRLYHL